MKNTDLALKFSKLLLIATAIFFVIVYIFVALSRISYPFQLEAAEGQSLVQVQRIIAGEPYYVNPSLEYITTAYTPLYFYFAAYIAKIIGATFLPLRLLSFVSSLGCLILIFLIVKRETKNNFPGIVAAGMFAAMFKIGGAWYDIGRVDSLFLFFLLLGLYFLKTGNWKSQVLAGIFIALSFLTKQTTAVISLPLILYAIIANRKRSVFFISSYGALAGAGTLLIYLFNKDWFFYYFLSAGRHAVLKNRLIDFWTQDIFMLLPIACVLIIYYFYKNRGNLPSNIYFLATVGMMTGAYISRIDIGGYNNVLLPAYASIAILIGLTVDFIEKTSTSMSKIALTCLLFVQFALLLYFPANLIPTKHDAQMGHQLVDMISKFDGDVFIPNHPYILSMAGKKGHAYSGTIFDALTFKKRVLGDKIQKEIEAAISNKRFSAIILDNYFMGLAIFLPTIEKHYTKKGLVFQEPGFMTVTGLPMRPQDIYVPVNASTT